MLFLIFNVTRAHYEKHPDITERQREEKNHARLLKHAQVVCGRVGRRRPPVYRTGVLLPAPQPSLIHVLPPTATPSPGSCSPKGSLDPCSPGHSLLALSSALHFNKHFSCICFGPRYRIDQYRKLLRLLLHSLFVLTLKSVVYAPRGASPHSRAHWPPLGPRVHFWGPAWLPASRPRPQVWAQGPEQAASCDGCTLTLEQRDLTWASFRGAGLSRGPRPLPGAGPGRRLWQLLLRGRECGGRGPPGRRPARPQ